jgi:hypothetical protein
VVITTLVVFCGVMQAVPYGVYAEAGRHWLHAQPLYDLSNIDGFQYFPQSALIFTPFAWLGTPAGDIAWRAISWFGYACGLWRLARQLAPARARECFLLASGFAVTCASNNLGNGQANLALAALMLHIAADLTERHYARATALLTFGLCLKPLMLVMLLLVWPLERELRWRIPAALIIAVFAPFLLREHAYVVRQYLDSWAKLRLCAAPDRLFEDLRSLLVTLGLGAKLRDRPFTLLRVVAAGVTLATAFWMRARLPRARFNLFVVALAGTYLMLFNPRTLSSSYTMPMAAAALLEASYLLHRRWAAAAVLSGVLASWTIHPHLFPAAQHCLRPLAALAFSAMLVGEVLAFQRRARAARDVSATELTTVRAPRPV